MAEIDYAFLADYAKVEPNGVLTAVGASWTFAESSQFPTAWRLAVACRVRATLAEGAIPFQVVFRGPVGAANTVTLTAGGELVPGEVVRPYGPEGRVGHLFAIDMQVPLPAPGLYEVEIELPQHGDRRRLAFDAVRPEIAP